MLFKGKNSLKKSDGGAILLQTLLGLGLMVAMTPIILNQIRKYNESVNREEVVSQMSLLQKAVTSYISFDRTSVPSGCVVKSGNEMKDLLSDYGGERISTSNAFGQTYSFITCKKTINAGENSSDIIEAAIFASGEVDDLTLNSIGEYLFDQGVVLSNIDHTELTNYNAKLSQTLKTEISKVIGNHGALVMFVSDAFMVSDYLYINKGPGGTTVVNTMLADINMNGNSLIDVYKANGTTLDVLQNLKVAGLAGKKMEIADTTVSGIISIENTQPFVTESSDTNMNIITDTVDINSLQVENVNVLNAVFDPGELKTEKLETQNLVVEGDVNVVEGTSTSEDGGSAISGWNFAASNVEVDNLSSKGTVSNQFSNIYLKDGEDEVESYIYDGTFNNNMFDIDESTKINLSGISEVYDICYLSGIKTECISDKLVNFYDIILNLWKKYNDKYGD
ncbi:MAG: hypothetical protein ACI4N3_01810 [Alphaproteobacteria bacterium]